MDQKLLREREAKCVQEEAPGCTAGCPVHVDARGIIAAVRKEDYAAGFALLHRIVPFPRIISRICDQPCRQTCKREEIDEAIAVNAIEKICVDHSAKAPLKLVVPPLKTNKIAVVGAGLSSLTVAVELSRKGYPVVIYEATDRIGGRVWDMPASQLPRNLIEDDFAILAKLPVEIRYHTSVAALAGLCQQYAAVYLDMGTGTDIREVAGVLELGLDDEGNVKVDPVSLATTHPKVFAGGGLRRQQDNWSPIFSVSDGKIAAISIDRLLQNASLTANREKEGQLPSTLYTNIQGVEAQPLTTAACPDNGYSVEEARQEAGRCLFCQCLECVKVCEYLAHYRAYPKRYVREVYNNLSIVMGIHHANKMINSCSLCGLCEQVCPEKLNMGQIYQEARQMMVGKGKMPPSAHDFALRDMQYSNSDCCQLTRHQPGFVSSRWVFYPGCQLAASAPHYVKKVYEYLCEQLDGGVGIMLGCCGAPANWAGKEDLFKEVMETVKANWRSLGSPGVITACPTCYMVLSHQLPAMAVESLWTLLDEVGLPEIADRAISPRKFALHDSCTTRHEADLHASVRNIVGKLGHRIEELPLSRQYTTCCGYGGLMLYVNREVAHKVINRRIAEAEPDYLAYCAMCRDNFAGQGKSSYHLLDLIFGSQQDQLGAVGPDYSQRQQNRATLKIQLLRDMWDEPAERPAVAINVIIPDAVRKVMEDRMILVDDVARVVAYAESSGRKLQQAASGHYIAYLQPDAVTYWVEYSAEGDGFIIHNAYCHRLNITG